MAHVSNSFRKWWYASEPLADADMVLDTNVRHVTVVTEPEKVCSTTHEGMYSLDVTVGQITHDVSVDPRGMGAFLCVTVHRAAISIPCY